ncbi:MAG TPA: hypothetical protein VE199_02425, partial [Nitrososphaera sp.]|nr:hypothetical protein [Nitrososphaera sp.]
LNLCSLAAVAFRYLIVIYSIMEKLCTKCGGKIHNTSLTVCGKCSRRCEWCGARLNQLNPIQTCGFCKTGEVLGKVTHKLGIGRLSKSFLRTALSDKNKEKQKSQ